jgi:organic hydroperoxide reductase OsmC/OhrA
MTRRRADGQTAQRRFGIVNKMPGTPPRHHLYQVTNVWTGNLGSGTSAYRSYSRNHELSGPAKFAPIAGSSDPLFRGDPSRYNPEELLVGALSACHMLWVLHLCADAGIVVTGYTDEALGEMDEHEDGSAEFTRVVLRPRMTLADPGRAVEAISIHHRAHQVCGLARSVNFPVEHQPEVVA